MYEKRHNFENKQSKSIKFFLDSLDIPEDYQLNYIIAIGYPDEQPEAKPRDEGKVKYIIFSHE